MKSIVLDPTRHARRIGALATWLGSLWLLALLASSTLAQEAADAAPAAAPVGAETAAPKISMLNYLLKAHSDPLAAGIGLLLLGLSIYFVAQVIRFFMEFRVEEAVPPALVEKVETAVREKRIQEAYEACRDDNSFVARLIRTGIANLQYGRTEAKESMNVAAEETVVTLESRISYLATIGTLGPMIGLVGTIWGMIHSFQEIATAGGRQPRADQVASGIATALFITLEGVALSVPAIFFFAFFRNRIAQMAMEATKVADRTINAIWTAAKQSPTPAPPAAAKT